MLLNKSVKMLAVPSNQTQKEWAEQFLVKTRLAVSFKYFTSQKYFAAETVQGKAGSNRWISCLLLMCVEQQFLVTGRQ